MKNVIITSASRTAVGSLNKTLKNVPGFELGSNVIVEAIKKSNLNTNEIDEVIFGQVLYPNGQPKVNELVILTAKKAQLMISKTDKNGYWNLNLGNMKTLTGQAFTDLNEVYFSLLGSNKIYRQVVKDLIIQQSSTMHWNVPGLP